MTVYAGWASRRWYGAGHVGVSVDEDKIGLAIESLMTSACPRIDELPVSDHAGLINPNAKPSVVDSLTFPSCTGPSPSPSKFPNTHYVPTSSSRVNTTLLG